MAAVATVRGGRSAGGGVAARDRVRGTTPPTDPLDQMVIAFQGSPSRAEIQSSLIDALLATGEAVNDDTKSRAGSALVSLRREYGVSEMDMLACIPDVGSAAPNISFGSAAGLCAAELSLE